MFPFFFLGFAVVPTLFADVSLKSTRTRTRARTCEKTTAYSVSMQYKTIPQYKTINYLQREYAVRGEMEY